MAHLEFAATHAEAACEAAVSHMSKIVVQLDHFVRDVAVQRIGCRYYAPGLICFTPTR